MKTRSSDGGETLVELGRRCARLHSDISASEFLETLGHMERLCHLGQGIFTYAELLSHDDSIDAGVAAFRSEIARDVTDGENREACFWNWRRSLDDANAQRLADLTPTYRRSLLSARLQAVETPAVEIEPVGSEVGASVLTHLRNEYDRLATQTRMAGNTYAQHQYSPDRDVRARSHEAVRRLYGDQAEQFGANYSKIVHAWHRERVDLSLDREPISAVNRANDIGDGCARNAEMR